MVGMKIVGTAGDRREEVPVEPQTVSFPQFRAAGTGTGPQTRLRALRIRAVEIRAVEIVGAEIPVPRAPASQVRTPGVLTFGSPEVGDDDGTPPQQPPGRPGRRGRIAAAVGVAAVGAAAMSTALFQTVVASSTSLPMHEPAPAPAPQPAAAVLAAPDVAPAASMGPVQPSPAVYGDDTVGDPWADPMESGR